MIEIPVKLTKPHKQGDVQHYAGETVMLDLETANWLVMAQLQERSDIAARAALIPGTPEFEEAQRAVEQS